jgi:hypothetical protein
VQTSKVSVKYNLYLYLILTVRAQNMRQETIGLNHEVQRVVLNPIQYSVVGFLETVWLLDTLIRKLLQNLLDPIVIIFRSIYTYVRDSD